VTLFSAHRGKATFGGKKRRLRRSRGPETMRVVRTSLKADPLTKEGRTQKTGFCQQKRQHGLEKAENVSKTGAGENIPAGLRVPVSGPTKNKKNLI